MNLAIPIGIAILAAIMAKKSREPKAPRAPQTPSQSAMEGIIRREARAFGVPEPVALATAWVESRLDPFAEGDKAWHENEKRFEAVVPKDNPHRWQRALWHSYGLFQLLAPYHVRKNESPLVLLDPETNANRGVAYLARLIKRHVGNLDDVRLAYTGALQAPADVQDRILRKWHDALARYGYDDPRV